MVGWVRVFSLSTMFVGMVLSTWLLCMIGCLMSVFRLYRQLRQFVIICAGSSRFLM